jgi:DNA polymerase I
MSSEKKLIIIDSSSLLYRAFHALPPLTNNNGQPTGAVYGFLLTLFRAIKDVQANYVVACFDTPKPTFRHQVFDDYKAHRAPTPDGIISQFPILKEVLNSFNIPLFEKEGFEADDLIATIAKKVAKEEDAKVYIVSGDLDNLQLVDEKITLYTLGKGIKDSVMYDKTKVVERFGVEPSQMNDFKALTGDNSDNVPGVPGIGKTTAAELINTFGTIAHLYEELATDTAVLKPKIKEALKSNKESAFLSLDLVTTKQDVELDFHIAACKFGDFDSEKVESKFRELGFNSLTERLSGIVFH